MRQLPVIGLLLLIPANAVSAAHFHVRSTTYACVDPKAALAPGNASLRAKGRCFRVHPTQRLEQIWRPSHSLVLLRLKPPHVGVPPLYFRTSSVTPLRSHRGRHEERGWHGSEARAGWLHARGAHGIPRHRLGEPETIDLPSATIAPAAMTAPAAALALPPATVLEARSLPESVPNAPASSKPASNDAARSAPTVPTTTGLAPRIAAPGIAAPGIAAPKIAAEGSAVRADTRPAQGSGRFNHVFATLLLWAVIVAGAVLLVRIALVRKPRPAEAAAAPLREPTWSGPSIWPEPAAEPLGGRMAAADGAGEATGRVDPPAPAPTRTQPVYGAPAGAVGFASSYAIGQVAASPADDERPGANPAWRELPEQEQPAELSAYKNRCVAGLRHAGWDARTRFSAGVPGPDVIAHSGGLVLALRCLPSAEPVDVEAVEDACLVRERQRSDLAAIVSNAAFTDAARQLAARTGIVLLHENELSSFAA